MNTIRLEDPDLDALLRAADPAPAPRMFSDEAADELHESITADELATRRRRIGRRPLLVAAAAAVAAAVGIGVAVVGPSSHDDAYAAGAGTFAKTSPRLLVGAGGWKVAEVLEDGADSGEIDFSLTGRENDHGPWFDVNWFAGATEHESDKQGQVPQGTATIDGHPAWIGRLPKPSAGKYEFEAIWADGDRGLTAKGEFVTLHEFLAVATSLHEVDAQTFLDTLPAEMVKPDARRAAVKQMLADIPQPKGFDPTPLYTDQRLKDRYQVGADTTGAVTCGWIHQWVRGDAAAKRQASQAMATWPQWRILREMDKQGAWSEPISDIAAYMNGKDGQVRKSGQTLSQWAGGAIGCHS